jgi:hypothetical protein
MSQKRRQMTPFYRLAKLNAQGKSARYNGLIYQGEQLLI